MPPATEPAAPPMNISPENVDFVTSFTSPKSIIENPAVRPLTELKMAPKILSNQLKSPIVAELLNSDRYRTNAPSTQRTMLVTSTSLVSNENREIRRLRNTSTTKTQPRPPRIIKTVIVINNPGSEKKRVRLLPPGTSGMMLKPALLNDETERNIECHTDRRLPTPSIPLICRKITTAPIAYSKNTTPITARPRWRNPPIWSTPMVSRIRSRVRSRSCRVDRWPINNRMNVLMTMNPKPPTIININMTAWPNVDQ